MRALINFNVLNTINKINFVPNLNERAFIYLATLKLGMNVSPAQASSGIRVAEIAQKETNLNESFRLKSIQIE